MKYVNFVYNLTDKINLHTQLQFETTTEETVGPIIG